MRRLVPVLLAALVAGVALAQSPREQLNQFVVQLLANPADQALRERIIKLAQEIKPPPAVPEEARRSFVEGMTIAKAAQNAAQQALAVQRFREATVIAPWWGDAYYNLAVAQESAGLFEAAQASLKLYLLTNPGERDAREAQDRIYALSAKKAMAAMQQASPETAAERARKLLESLEGRIWVAPTENVALDPRINNGRSMMYQRRVYVVRSRNLVRQRAFWYSGQLEPPLAQGEEVDRVALGGLTVTYRSKDIDDNCNPVTLRLSEDGSTLTQNHSCYGRTSSIVYHRAQR